MSIPAFEKLVVRAPGTTKRVAGQPEIMMQLSDGQPYIYTKTHQIQVLV